MTTTQRSLGPQSPRKESPRLGHYRRQESGMQIVEAANKDDVNELDFGKAVLEVFCREVEATRLSHLNNDDGELHMRAERQIDPTQPGQRATNPEIMKAIMFRAKF
ncbi:hypothetical protein VTL71DRAFT_6990 [Oculimacula yallundae]|uniref:Uncharacterized protein n=1 Tax=Oculimacula yallundae TaxID=86028 RepID=A0ABR4BY11_9HELO